MGHLLLAQQKFSQTLHMAATQHHWNVCMVPRVREVTKQTKPMTLHCDRQVRRGQEGRGKAGVEQLKWSQLGAQASYRTLNSGAECMIHCYNWHYAVAQSIPQVFICYEIPKYHVLVTWEVT